MAEAVLREANEIAPLRVDRDGLALLRERLRQANTTNATFATQQKRLFEILQTVLHRLESEFSDTIERVNAIGDWARYGIDLRNLPFDDIVLLIVVRLPERPFALYLQIANDVFADLGDDDILLQFQLATEAEWQDRAKSARQRGVPDVLGIPLFIHE